MVGDSFENIASLQDCHFQQRDSVQTLGETSSSGSLSRRTIPICVYCGCKALETSPSKHNSKESACLKSFELRTENLFSYFLAFSPGVNTKQLANQMLDLTKVINELKDVLIQQVRPVATPGHAIATPS